jgi:hypothetical protein
LVRHVDGGVGVRVTPAVCHANGGPDVRREAGETPALPATRDGWVVARVFNDFVS